MFQFKIYDYKRIVYLEDTDKIKGNLHAIKLVANKEEHKMYYNV